ncbi:hypothetical protein RJ45_11410 [Photobacterium gaetbulicola]|uniref:AAA+ ATPase domain-containing protein n=1 Tax=Photobacterium gaetbulicola TaxID=1295392 RepID=A0A0B9GXS2_9GAMM|nr:AAA family ATPase [Photobacterium gaetbulicola]KHT63551.1 hypothetical protein RJ45_11410 [Photobacterium gaetbulicola]
MNNINLTEKFLGNVKIVFDEKKLSTDIVSSEWAFLPMIFLVLDKVIGDESARLLYDYDLVADSESLFGFKVSFYEVHRPDLVNEVIDAIGGVNSIKHNFDFESDYFENGFQIKTFSNEIKKKLNKLKNGRKVEADRELKFIFERFPLAEHFEERSKEFNIKERYSRIDTLGKSLLDEIAVVALADYMHKNLESDVLSLCEKGINLKADLKLVLAASLNHPEMMKSLSKRFNCPHYKIAFEQSVYDAREVLSKIAETRSVCNSSSNSKTWYQVAKSMAPNLLFDEAVANCFAVSVEDDVLVFDKLVTNLFLLGDALVEYMNSSNTVKNHGISSAFSGKKIENRLNETVIGQHKAVEDVARGYVTSCIEQSVGPRFIYTFAGPSGVGKTFLAEQLKGSLNELDHAGYDFNVFNMELCADHQDDKKLFGSGIQFADASMGMLTSCVRAQPRQILLFDEIEKAHPRVIQSLLTVLDSGKVKDNTSQEVVDFSQSIVIFTTNLGHELIEMNPQDREICIFDVLKTSRDNVHDKTLLPEFVNRLAKGASVYFNALLPHHFIKMVERQIAESESVPSDIEYIWPETFPGFLLKSVASNLSVRSVKARLAKFKSDILDKSLPYLSEDDFSATLNISVEQQHEQRLNVTLVDDCSAVFDKLNKLGSEHQINRANTLDTLTLSQLGVGSDVLLIKLDLLVEMGLDLKYIHTELKLDKRIPIFTFSSNSKLADWSLPYECCDIRCHFSLNERLNEEDLAEMYSTLSYYSSGELALSKMKRRGEQLDYRIKVMPTSEKLDICFVPLAVKQSIASEDLREGELFQRELPKTKMDEVIGLDRAKWKLNKAIGWLNNPDLLQRAGVKMPSGYLFSGPPGNGKTLLAKAVAGESELPFFSVSASELVCSYAGGTAKNIRRLFAMARKYAPAIIYLDEIDAIAGKRKNGTSQDKEWSLAVNTLLVEMDGFEVGESPVFVIASTNHPDLLDDAVLRPGRFDEVIECDLPDSKARRVFFERFVESHQVETTGAMIDSFVASTSGMSAADIDQTLRETLYRTVVENQPLSVKAMSEALIEVCYGKASDTVRLDASEKQRIAYHEAGHLLVSHLLLPEKNIDFVTIEPRNQKLGFVAIRARDEYKSQSTRSIKHQLEVLLAGRAAEKALFVDEQAVSCGASNDIAEATKLARYAVYQAGLDTCIGPVNVEVLSGGSAGCEVDKKAQEAVSQWLNEAQDNVSRRISDNRAKLDFIASQLIDKESLNAPEIRALLNRMEIHIQQAV